MFSLCVVLGIVFAQVGRPTTVETLRVYRITVHGQPREFVAGNQQQALDLLYQAEFTSGAPRGMRGAVPALSDRLSTLADTQREISTASRDMQRYHREGQRDATKAQWLAAAKAGEGAVTTTMGVAQAVPGAGRVVGTVYNGARSVAQSANRAFYEDSNAGQRVGVATNTLKGLARIEKELDPTNRNGWDQAGNTASAVGNLAKAVEAAHQGDLVETGARYLSSVGDAEQAFGNANGGLLSAVGDGKQAFDAFGQNDVGGGLSNLAGVGKEVAGAMGRKSLAAGFDGTKMAIEGIDQTVDAVEAIGEMSDLKSANDQRLDYRLRAGESALGRVQRTSDEVFGLYETIYDGFDPAWDELAKQVRADFPAAAEAYRPEVTRAALESFHQEVARQVGLENPVLGEEIRRRLARRQAASADPSPPPYPPGTVPADGPVQGAAVGEPLGSPPSAVDPVSANQPPEARPEALSKNGPPLRDLAQQRRRARAQLYDRVRGSSSAVRANADVQRLAHLRRPSVPPPVRRKPRGEVSTGGPGGGPPDDTICAQLCANLRQEQQFPRGLADEMQALVDKHNCHCD